jgi:hypothetical protein
MSERTAGIASATDMILEKIEKSRKNIENKKDHENVSRKN